MIEFISKILWSLNDAIIRFPAFMKREWLNSPLVVAWKNAKSELKVEPPELDCRLSCSLTERTLELSEEIYKRESDIERARKIAGSLSLDDVISAEIEWQKNESEWYDGLERFLK